MFRRWQINVRRAPEPSTILWENLAVSDGNRMPRKSLTTSVAIIVMLLSVVVTFLSKWFSASYFEENRFRVRSYLADLSEDEKLRFIMNDSGKSMLVVMCINMLAPHMSVIWNYMNFLRAISVVERQLVTNQQQDWAHEYGIPRMLWTQFFVGPEFTLNYRLSQILLTLFFCWMYFTSMPLMPLQYWVYVL